MIPLSIQSKSVEHFGKNKNVLIEKKIGNV